MTELLHYIADNKAISREAFENIGGQLVPVVQVEALLASVKDGSISTWDEMHTQYHQWSDRYLTDKFNHALAALAEVTETALASWDKTFIQQLLQESLSTRAWICAEIFNSRSKDYENPFKLMVYESMEEMEEVVGSLSDNAFINSERKAFEQYKAAVEPLLQ